MAVTIECESGVMIAVLQGDIDHHNAQDIRQMIDQAVERDKPNVLKLDFQQVEFMDSSGIGLIMGRYKLMQMLKGKLFVIHVPPTIAKVIRLSGLAQLGILERK